MGDNAVICIPTGTHGGDGYRRRGSLASIAYSAASRVCSSAGPSARAPHAQFLKRDGPATESSLSKLSPLLPSMKHEITTQSQNKLDRSPRGSDLWRIQYSAQIELSSFQMPCHRRVDSTPCRFELSRITATTPIQNGAIIQTRSYKAFSIIFYLVIIF